MLWWRGEIAARHQGDVGIEERLTNGVLDVAAPHDCMLSFLPWFVAAAERLGNDPGCQLALVEIFLLPDALGGHEILRGQSLDLFLHAHGSTANAAPHHRHWLRLVLLTVLAVARSIVAQRHV